MTEDNLEKELEGKIKSINKLIPYPKNLKNKLLNNYFKDLQEEITETSKLPDDLKLGSRILAQKLAKSLDWPVNDASLKKRTLAYMIDLPFSFIFSLLIYIVFLFLFNLYNPHFFEITRSFFPALAIFLLTVSTWLYGLLLYPFLFEGIFSTTIGKKLVGLVIINNGGIKITWTQSFIRSITKLFPLLLLFETFIGFYQMKTSQRIMDTIANTRVIEITEKTVIDKYIQKIQNKIPNHKRKIGIPIRNLKIELEEIYEAEGKKNPIEIYGSPDEIAKNMIKSNNLNNYRSATISRILAYLIDLILSIFIGVFIMLIPAEFILSLNRSYFMYVTDIFKLLVVLFIGSIPLYALVFYPIILEGLFSRTIGKWLLGLWIIDESGIKISWNQAVIRSLTKIIPILLIIEVFYLFNSKKENSRPLDRIAKTKVVKIK